MKFFFLKIYHFFDSHRSALWLTLLTVVTLCVLSALRLHFVEDIGSFLPNNRNSKRINEAYQHLGGDNKLVVSIAMADTAAETDVELLSSAADLLAEKLSEADTAGLIKQLRHQVEDQEITSVMTFVLDNLPYFLTEDDYARMDTMLTPAHMATQLAADRQLLASPVPMMRPMIQRDPLFFASGALKSLSDFKLDDTYQTDNDHIFNKEGTESQVIVTSNYPLSETKRNGELIRLIDKAMEDVAREQEGKVHISCFGASQVSLTNSRQIKKDSFTAIGISLLLIIALLYYYYRNFRSILMILVSITFGGLFAMGLIALIKNPVSVIAIGVASIILGIAINYPIHFLSHFKRTDDKEQILKDIVNPLLIGNITTVGAFLSLLFISSDAMKDLGLFAALLLAGTILFVLIFLPHLTGKHFQGSNRDLAFRRVAEFRFENIRGLFWAIAALTIVFYIFSLRTTFDTDMHHINYMTKEQRATFDKLRAESDTTVHTVYAIAEGRTLDEALAHQEQLLQKLATTDNVYPSAIVHYSGIGRFLPSQETQRQRIERWNAFWEGKRETFCADLDQAALQNGFNPEAFAPCKDIIQQEYTIQDSTFFQPIEEQLASSYVVNTENKVMIYNILKVKKEKSKEVEEYLNRIVSADGFAFTDTSIASRLVSALSSDFNYVLYICGIIVFAFLLFSFGRLEISLMAFLPLFIAWIWILGIMGMTGIRFNIVNIILATFIFGMGDDYSIFVTEGLLYEYAYGRKMLAQFKNSIILSASIMFISIGMLVFAKHPAMRSLAEVTIIGMFSVVLMAYIIPPLVFKWLTTKKGQPRKQPVTLRSALCSIIGFPYFFLGVVALTISGFFLLTLGGRTDKHKLQYHKVLRQLLFSTAHVIPNSSFRILNPNNENFEKPAVVICNHQSHFDLLYTLLLTPKIIALTNDWAWNMPLYRRILRNGDFLPASYGFDQNFSKLKQMVEKGYSVLVFPEGTRSADQSILRFHQGAFLLADKLGVDVLPIVAHGIGDMFPKYDTYIHRGQVTVSIGERITADDERFRQGRTPLETARLMRHFYIDRYAEFKKECETPDYLKDIILHKYIYKGKSIENQCRGKLTWRQNVADALASVPENATLLYKNCGHGELSLLAALLRPDLNIMAFDADEDNIAIASHCTQLPDNLHYTHTLPDPAAFDHILDETNL
ncbi:MAG: 1-acyl-sn-glycerol-3-phosphate acyltransferase [Bacteroidales bacterium]|nr:1-acyl-sn-glycerol-3-phosphate acyltransferase [Bacteroidales bacterium]